MEVSKKAVRVYASEKKQRSNMIAMGLCANIDVTPMAINGLADQLCEVFL